MKSGTVQQRTCSSCGTQEAVFICSCRRPGMWLCSECAKTHSALSGLHMSFPASVSTLIYNSEYTAAVQQRVGSLLLAQSELRENIKRMEQFEMQIEAVCADLIEAIKRYQAEAVEKVNEAKKTLMEKIESAVLESTERVYEERWIPRNPLVSYLWKYQPGTLTFFRCTISPYRVLSVLPSISDFSVADLGKKNFLPLIKDNVIRIFDCPSNCWRPSCVLSVPVNSVVSSAAIWLPDDQLFVCGGFEPLTSDAFTICPASGEVKRKTSMSTAKYGHGAVLFGLWVYVFGGHNGRKYLNICEKFDLTTDRWTNMKELPVATGHTNPCLNGTNVYICGGGGSNTCQLFDIIQETYQLLPIKTALATSETCVLVHDNELLIIQNGCIATWPLHGAYPMKVVRFTDPCNAWWGGMAPVNWEDELFLMSFKGYMCKLQLKTQKATRVQIP